MTISLSQYKSAICPWLGSSMSGEMSLKRIELPKVSHTLILATLDFKGKDPHLWWYPCTRGIKLGYDVLRTPAFLRIENYIFHKSDFFQRRGRLFSYPCGINTLPYHPPPLPPLRAQGEVGCDDAAWTVLRDRSFPWHRCPCWIAFCAGYS